MSNEQFFEEESSATISQDIKPEQIKNEVLASESPKKKAKTVSFSQYAMWLKCPQQWKLSYIDKLAPYEASIHTAFGTAIHSALQEYLKILYTVGATEADALDTLGTFYKKYAEETAKLKLATEEQLKLPVDELDELDVITPTTIEEFKNDGKVILEHVLSYSIRSKHFPSKKYELIGIELPLEVPLRGGNIVYKGYLDIVFKDKLTNKILIIDAKTSTNGWNKWTKQDRTKLDQLILYKRFYNKVFDVPMDSIEVEFFIVKRRLLENVEYPQQRIQRFSPASGKMSVKQVEESFLEFINKGFDKNGEYNKDGHFKKSPGKAKKNCKYCIFKTLTDKNGLKYCDGKES